MCLMSVPGAPGHGYAPSPTPKSPAAIVSPASAARPSRRRIACGGEISVAGMCPGDQAADALDAVRSHLQGEGRMGRLRRAGDPRWRSLEEIVRAQDVIAAVERGELSRLLAGGRGVARVIAFADACREDPTLRAQAEEQGIEIDDWAGWIREGLSYAT